MRNAPAISMSSARETIAALSADRLFRVSMTAAALLLTTVASCAPAKREAGSGRRAKAVTRPRQWRSDRALARLCLASHSLANPTGHVMRRNYRPMRRPVFFSSFAGGLATSSRSRAVACGVVLYSKGDLKKGKEAEIIHIEVSSQCRRRRGSRGPPPPPRHRLRREIGAARVPWSGRDLPENRLCRSGRAGKPCYALRALDIARLLNLDLIPLYSI
jgi:hypothetical protein